MSLNIVRGVYNPGMRPFAPQPICRFDGDKKIGDAGVTYEWNVKIYGLPSAADEYEWDHEVQEAFASFAEAAEKRWPWIGRIYQNGRSGGWLAVEDPDGRMTERSLKAMRVFVEAALARFKRHMVKVYPQVSP